MATEAVVQDDAVWYRVDSELRHLQRRLELLKGDRSQRQWALELGIHQQTVNKWLTAGKVPDVAMVLRVALVEGVSVEWLLLGQGSPDLRT